MSSNMPPVPPENRSKMGAGGAPEVPTDTAPNKRNEDRQRNLAEQGRHGNIKQNTTHQGYQQDR